MILLLGVILLACRYVSLEAAEFTSLEGAGLGRMLGCHIDVHSGEARCAPISFTGGAASEDGLEVFGGVQWMAETEVVGHLAADSTYRLNLRIINHDTRLLGSPDSSTVTGVRVFIAVPPTECRQAANDAGGDPCVISPHSWSEGDFVKARNPDGVQGFTGPDQPYWLYAQKLEPGGRSAWREWTFTVPPGASCLYVVLGISAAVPGQEWLTSAQAPRSWTIPPESVRVLYSPERAVRTHRRLNGPYPRNVLSLGFRQDATVEERQAAIDLVEGRVIGGWAGVIYQIVLPDDGTADPLWNAIDRLSALPQVELAQPDIMMQGPTLYEAPEGGTSRP